MPEPKITPQRNASSFLKSSPLCRTASMPATSANCVKRSMRLHFFGRGVFFGGRPVENLAAELHLESFGVEQAQAHDAALAAQNALPEVFYFVAQRGDSPQAGDDDASVHGDRWFYDCAFSMYSIAWPTV